jgi:hypothetical protein
MQPLFVHKVLGKHDVQYFECKHCGTIATEEPFWLAEAYQNAISTLDTWGAMRNVGNQRRLEAVLHLLFGEGTPFVDVACGYGLLVRLMRDIGFDFRGHDEFCQPVFSVPFTATDGTRAAAVTALEVLEHLTNPRDFIEEQFTRYSTDSLIASTTVYAGEPPAVDWPYYSFESGQHVIIYQPRSLAVLAQALGARYHSLGNDLHLITRRNFPTWKLGLLRTPVVRRLHQLAVRWRRAGRSLTLSDYENLRASILSQRI